MRQKLKIGFTLIELLVVVAIIAVLVAILLPALSAARESARAIVCGSNLRSMAIAAMQYANDENGYLPGNSTSAPNWADIIDWWWPVPLRKVSWAGRLGEIYLHHNWKAYYCPSATPYTPAAWGMPPAFPAQLSDTRPGTSYLMTGYCGRIDDVGSNIRGRRLDSIDRPDYVIMFRERASNAIVSSVYPRTPEFDPGEWAINEPGIISNSMHQYNPNYAFPDGHVERIRSGQGGPIDLPERFWEMN